MKFRELINEKSEDYPITYTSQKELPVKIPTDILNSFDDTPQVNYSDWGDRITISFEPNYFNKGKILLDGSKLQKFGKKLSISIGYKGGTYIEYIYK